jgi:hypothetical protein
MNVIFTARLASRVAVLRTVTAARIQVNENGTLLRRIGR